MEETIKNVLNRHAIANRDGPERHHASGAEPTHGAGSNEAPDGLRERAPSRGGGEDGHGNDVQRLAPDGVGQAADERLEGRRGEQVGGREPRRHVRRAEVRRDDRVRRRHDCAAEVGDEVRQHCSNQSQQLLLK